MKKLKSKISNKDIAKTLKLGGKLLELHGENPFKIKSYMNAGFQIEKLNKKISDISVEELENINGIGKNIAKKIQQLLVSGTYDELDRLIEQTPGSLIELLNIKGLGTKKIRILWTKLNITSIEELLHACNNNKLENLKGFGKKTQDNVLSAISYALNNRGKYLLSDVLETAEELKILIENSGTVNLIEITGELRRKCQIIQKIEYLVVTDDMNSFRKFIEESFESIEMLNDSLICNLKGSDFPIVFNFCTKTEYIKTLFITTGHPLHVQKISSKHIEIAENENEIYKKAGLPYIIPEMREGKNEFEIALKTSYNDLIDIKDFRGILHTHTNYSDGKNSLIELSDFVRKKGYEYLGITDHSQTAVYAGGLKPETVFQQFEEIDKYNEINKDFKILKGIESDILKDGSLDYEESILKKFDFIVASIHSGFNMTKEEATVRLIKAVENPCTSILGHMTGRLLLIRDGYPVDHAKVIDACASSKVSIELNANPQRLDIDWQWLYKAMDKNVMISINPDAHDIEHVSFIKYGVFMAKKAGIPKEYILNTLSLQEIIRFFNKS